MTRRSPPEQALQEYMDDLLDPPALAERNRRLEQLLSSAPPTDAQLIEPPPEQAAPVDAPAAPEPPVPDPAPEPFPEPVPEPESPPAPKVATETAPEVFVEAVSWLDNGRPPWAQSRFEVLLFRVSGLTLAVPLVALGQIYPITEQLSPLFGQADWFMGLQPTPQGQIRTVNTAKFVMPERYDPAFERSARYVLSINGLPWGLAVDAVNQPVALEPDEVKWRSDRSKRPWLAGTVKERMCALLDIPTMGQLLNAEADRR